MRVNVDLHIIEQEITITSMKSGDSFTAAFHIGKLDKSVQNYLLSIDIALRTLHNYPSSHKTIHQYHKHRVETYTTNIGKNIFYFFAQTLKS